MLQKMTDTVRWFSRKLRACALDAWAAQSAFFIVISFFPFVLLFVSICRTLHVAGYDMLGGLLALLPAAVGDFLLSMLYEAASQAETAVISVSALAALWAASRSIYAVGKGLSAVYETTETRGGFWVRFIALAYTVALLLMLAAALILLVFWQTIVEAVVPLFPQFTRTAVFILSFRWLVAVALFTLFFLLLYKVLPNNRLPFSRLFPGALFSALGWMVFSRLYSYYIDNFSGFPSLYGSLTVVVLLMLWLYACMYLLFFGAAVNMWLLQAKKPAGTRKPVEIPRKD